MAVGFLNANRMPLRAHENILVFYETLPKYHPQKAKGKPYHLKAAADRCKSYGHFKVVDKWNEGRYPIDVIKLSKSTTKKIHPTEKPVDLLEYMIRTYTDEGETVLDSCMGSGSCGVACQHLGRNFIGIEKDPGYFEAARKRIVDAVKQ